MKKMLLAGMLLVCAFQKSSGQPKHGDPVSLTETNVSADIVNKMFEAFNKHDWKAMTECYIDSAEFLDPSLGKKYIKLSHAQLISKYSAIQASAPDVHDQVIATYVDKDKVIIEFITSGTSSGQQWSFPICTVFTIKDGKIIRDATYYDQ